MVTLNKQCKLIIKDEVNIKFDGLDPLTRKKLSESMKFEVPGARYMPAYKLGRWDGTVSLCTIGASSYINALDVLLPIVSAAGYEIELIDNRKPLNIDFGIIDKHLFGDKKWQSGHPLEGENIVLRDYQVDCIRQYIGNLQSVQEISTGAGKTILTAALSYLVERSSNGRTLVIVPNKDLVEQTAEDYRNVGLDVGVYYGDKKDIGATHTISTWQSLMNLDKAGTIDGLNIIEAFIEDVNCVIVDEAHGAKGEYLKKMLTGPLANIPIRWGMTGTIPEFDHQAAMILMSIGETINELTTKELQDMGTLANCNVNIIQLQDSVDYKNYQEELKGLLMNPARMKYIANSIKNIAESGNTLILVDRIRAGELLEEFLPGSTFISGSSKTKDRKEQYERITEGDNQIVIATYGIAAVGINIPRIFNLVLIEPGKSYIKVIQSIGRGVRKAKDKDHVEIWDFTSSAKYSKRHLTKRKAFYKKKEFPHTVTKVTY